LTISKATFLPDIWEAFYDRMSSVTTVTLDDTTTPTIQTRTSSFPDREQDSKSDYPLIVVNSPSCPTAPFTFGKTEVEGTIRIEVFATKKETSDMFLAEIMDKIETYKDDFATLGLKRIEIDSTDSDMFMRGDIKLHVGAVVFGFKYKYSKTRAW